MGVGLVGIALALLGYDGPPVYDALEGPVLLIAGSILFAVGAATYDIVASIEGRERSDDKG